MLTAEGHVQLVDGQGEYVRLGNNEHFLWHTALHCPGDVEW